MANVSYKLKDLEQKKTIRIGYVGENNHMHVRIDCEEVFKEYPNAAVTMAITPPEGEDYPKVVTREGNVVEWTVANSDVAAEGYGEFQMTFTEGEVIRKTVTASFEVIRSIVGNGTAPSGIDDFLTDANAKLAAVDEAIQEAEDASSHAPRVGTSGYWETWDAETGAYVSTGTKAQGEQGDPGSPGDPTQLIDDTAGEGATGKTWSANKLDETTGQLLNNIQGVKFNNDFAQKVIENGSVEYDLTYDNHSVNDATGQQASSESATRCSTPDLYYVPFGCMIKISGYNTSAQTAQYYCFSETEEYLGAVYSFNADKSLKLKPNTRYIRFYMQNNDNTNITPEQAKSYGTYTCYYVGEVKELRDDVEELKDKIDPVAVSDNLIIGHEWFDGFYNGEQNISNSYKYVAAIPVENGKTYRVLPRSRMIYIMNASGSEINHVSGDNTMSITAGGDGFAYVTYYTADDLNYAVFYEDNARFAYPKGIWAIGDDVKPSPLRGKKWAVLGDSFTAGEDSGTLTDGIYKGQKIVYPYIIGNRTGIRILNYFEGGRTLAYPADGTFHNSVTDPNQNYYYQNIPADVDYITIYLGINDSHHAPASSGGDGEDNTGEIPLGTATDSTTATYYGAWNVVLSWLRENRPFAHIGIIVSNGCDTADYRAAMIAMAKKYGIPYLDLNGDERTPAMIRAQNNDIPSTVKNIIRDVQAVNVAGGNTHPNNNAHRFESTFIENFLCSI